MVHFRGVLPTAGNTWRILTLWVPRPHLDWIGIRGWGDWNSSKLSPILSVNLWLVWPASLTFLPCHSLLLIAFAYQRWEIQGIKRAANKGGHARLKCCSKCTWRFLGLREKEVLKRQCVVSGEWRRLLIPGVIIEDSDSRDSVRKRPISSSHGAPELVVDWEFCKDLGISACSRVCARSGCRGQRRAFLWPGREWRGLVKMVTEEPPCRSGAVGSPVVWPRKTEHLLWLSQRTLCEERGKWSQRRSQKHKQDLVFCNGATWNNPEQGRVLIRSVQLSAN